MEPVSGKILRKILTAEEFNNVSPDITKKLETFFVERFEEYITSKALCETAKTNIGE